MTRGAMRIVAATWESDACMVASKKRKGRCGSAPNFKKSVDGPQVVGEARRK